MQGSFVGLPFHAVGNQRVFDMPSNAPLNYSKRSVYKKSSFKKHLQNQLAGLRLQNDLHPLQEDCCPLLLTLRHAHAKDINRVCHSRGGRQSGLRALSLGGLAGQNVNDVDLFGGLGGLRGGSRQSRDLRNELSPGSCRDLVRANNGVEKLVCRRLGVFGAGEILVRKLSSTSNEVCQRKVDAESVLKALLALENCLEVDRQSDLGERFRNRLLSSSGSGSRSRRLRLHSLDVAEVQMSLLGEDLRKIRRICALGQLASVSENISLQQAAVRASRGNLVRILLGQAVCTKGVEDRGIERVGLLDGLPRRSSSRLAGPRSWGAGLLGFRGLGFFGAESCGAFSSAGISRLLRSSPGSARTAIR